MNLTKKLNAWQKAKIINSSQKNAILKFEENKNKPMFLYSFLFLAVFCIGLGVISLIAANWQEIPSYVKLAIDFAILLATTYGVYYAKQNKKNWLMEGLLLAFAIFLLASIALIAQIYQLQADGASAYFMWSVLILPLMLYSKKKVLAFFFVPVFFNSALSMMMNTNLGEDLLNYISNAFAFAMPIMVIMVLSVTYKTILAFFSNKNLPIFSALRVWIAIDIIILIVAMDFLNGTFARSLFNMAHPELGNNMLASSIVITIMALGVLALAYLSAKNRTTNLLTYTIATLFAFALMYQSLPDVEIVSQIWGFLLSIIPLLCLVLYALKKANHQLTNIATGLIALRIFIVYLQVFGSLAITGIGLILSGVVLLGIIYTWKRLNLSELLTVKEIANEK